MVERLIREYSLRYPPLITATEAAEIARHDSLGTVYDWSSRGLLDAIKSKRGRRMHLDLAGYIRFLVGQEGRPTQG